MTDPSYWSRPNAPAPDPTGTPLAAPPARGSRSRAPIVLLVVLLLGAGLVAVVALYRPVRHVNEISGTLTAPLVTLAPATDLPVRARVRPATVRQWTTVSVQAECNRTRLWQASALVRNDATTTRSAALTYVAYIGTRQVATLRGGAFQVAPGTTQSVRLVAGTPCQRPATSFVFSVEF